MLPARVRPLWVAVTLVAACGSPGRSSEPTATKCWEPSGPPAKPLEHKPSLVSVQFVVGKRRLQHELAKRIPIVLAQESGRSIGSPGRLSYVVKRGALAFSVKHNLFSVQTRMTGDISICKPLGPICARYGKCAPSWRAQVTLPLDWREPPTAATTVNLEHGCVLSPVGYDATDEVRKITDREARKVAARISQELKRGQEAILANLNRLRAPLQLGNPAAGEAPLCAGLDNPSVEYSVAESSGPDKHALSGVIQLRGHVHSDCGRRAKPPTPRYGHGLTTETLATFEAEIAFQAIEDGLSESATGRVLLRSVGGPNRENLLFAGIPQTGDCRAVWIKVEAVLAASGLLLRSDDPAAPAEWRNGRIIENPPEFSGLEHAAQRLMSSHEDAKAFAKRYDVDLQTPSDLHSVVRVGQRSLSLVLTLRGTTSLTAL